MSRKFKRMIAIVLIAVQIFTSHGVSLLAQGFGEQVSERLQSMQDQSNRSGSYVLDGEKEEKVNEETSQNKIDNNDNNSSIVKKEISNNAHESVDDEEEASLLDEPEEDETTEEENIKGEDTHEEETTGDSEFIGPVQLESEKVEEEETKEVVEETTPSSDEEKNSEQDSNADEASASEADEEDGAHANEEEAEIDKASASEADEDGAHIEDEVDEASASEADEEGARTDEDEEKIGIASYSEVFTVVASDSEIANKIHAEDIIKVASSSEIASASELDLLTLDEIVASKSDATLMGAVPNAGGTLFLGFYPQSSTDENVKDPIKWRVLVKNSGTSILISDKILFKTQYYYSWSDNTYKNSKIGTYLGSFVDAAFYGYKNTLRTTTQDNLSSMAHALSLSDLNVYLSLNTDRKATETAYASAGGSAQNRYWTSTQYGDGRNVMYAESNGSYGYGDGETTTCGVRPYIVINNSYFNNERSITWKLPTGVAFLDNSTWPQMTKYIKDWKIELPTTKHFKTMPTGATKLNNWKITNNGTVTYDTKISESLNGDITLEPIFDKMTFNITWDLKDDVTGTTGTWNGTAGAATYAYGTGITKLPTNVKISATGREFDHWEISGTTATSISTTETGDKTIKAVYKNTKYNIIWDLKDAVTGVTGTWDGDAGAATYTYGTGITTLPTNVKISATGREFSHWTIGGTTYTKLSTTETGAKTIKAVYKYSSYDITWDLKDDVTGATGTWNGTAGAATYAYGTGITKLPTNVKISVTGREFSHWTIGGTTYTKLSTTETGAKTIKAVYKNSSYNITWDLTDGDTADAGTWNAGVIASTSYTYGTGLTSLPTGVTGPTGRTFDHWEIGGVTATSISATETGDKTIKAVYTKNTYSISWDLKDTDDRDGTWNEGFIATTSYTYGTPYILPREVTGPDGRTFDYWEIGDETVTMISATETGDKTIKAVYKNSIYDITWDLTDTDGRTGSWEEGVVASTSYTYGTGFTLPTGVKAPTRREFDYWTIDEERVTEIKDTDFGDKIIKAVYKNATYNITWDLGDGSWDGEEGAKNYEYGTGYTLPKNVNAPDNYSFAYWINASTNGKITRISETYSGDITLKAVFSGDYCKIIYEIGEAWGVERINRVKYGEYLLLPNEVYPYDENKIFDYWMLDGKRAEIDYEKYGLNESDRYKYIYVDSDKTLTAVYKDNVEIEVQYRSNPKYDEYGIIEGEKKTYNYRHDTTIKMPSADKFELDGLVLLGFRPSNYDSGNYTRSYFEPDKEYDIREFDFNEGTTNYIYAEYVEKRDTLVMIKNVDAVGSDGVTYHGEDFDFGFYYINDKDSFKRLIEEIRDGFMMTVDNQEAFKFYGFSKEPGNTENIVTIDEISDGQAAPLIIKGLVDLEKEENEIYVVWKEKEYEVSFKGGYGTTETGKTINSDYESKKTVKYLQQLDFPTDPQLDGFVFKGWDTDEGKSSNPRFVDEKYDVKTLAESNVLEEIPEYVIEDARRWGWDIVEDWKERNNNFYAVWEEDKDNKIKTITYELDYGLFRNKKIVPTQRFSKDETELPTADNMYKYRYYFVGWQANIDGETKTITKIPADTSDIEVVAIWKERDDIAITYDFGGGVVKDGVTVQKVKSLTEDVKVPSKDEIEKTGYVLDKVVAKDIAERRIYAFDPEDDNYWQNDVEAEYNGDEDWYYHDIGDDYILPGIYEFQELLVIYTWIERDDIAITYDYDGGVLKDGVVAIATKSYTKEVKVPTQSEIEKTGYIVEKITITDDKGKVTDITDTGMIPSNTAEVTVKYVWKERDDITIKYDLDGGDFVSGYTEKKTRKYTENTTLPTADNVEKNGYTLIGWELTIDGKTEVVTSIPAKSLDVEVKAVYKNATYNITWDLTDGTTSDTGTWNAGVIASTSYTYGTGLTSLPTGVTGPTGRTFDHWEIGGVTATSISATETGDKTIKAVYTKNTYNITWDLTDGTTSDAGTWNAGVIASTSYIYGTGLTSLPTGVTAPNGRTFDHWEIGGVTATNISATETGDKTIKAVYTKNTYSITWDLTDGTTTDAGTWNAGVIASTSYTYGTPYTLPTGVTGPTGRTFDHWEIGGVTTTSISATETGDKTIKAVYTKNTYSIIWDLTDGTTSDAGTWNAGVIASTSYTYGTGLTSLPTGVTGPTGRTFDHWTIGGVTATNISATETGDKTIKAVYTKNTYSITWDLKDGTTSDEGTWSGTAGAATYIYGTGITTLPRNVTAPTGRTFDHWEIGGVATTSITTKDFGDKTIKAVYTKNTYNITWDLRDGNTTTIGLWDSNSGEAGKTTYTYGTEYVFPTNVTGPTGRLFDYWTINNVKTSKITATDIGDKTIKAVYKNEEYTIAWDLKDTDGRDGSWNEGVVASTSYIYGTAYSLPTGVTGPDGREFSHWTIDGSNATNIVAGTAGNKTVKAVYKNATYNITWDLTDANTADTGTWTLGIAGEATYTYGTGLASFRTNVTAPTGRTFDHWEIGGVVATNISTTDFGDKTIKAVYTKNTYNITWDLTDGNTGDEGTWSAGVIASTSYTYGTAYKLPRGVVGPNGRTFDHWEIGGVTVTKISATDTGDKNIKAVYTNNAYNITWDLKDGTTSDEGTWNGIEGKAVYTNGTAYILPRNVTGPTGRTFDHWEIDGETVTEIKSNATGDKIIKAVYTKNTYNITWDLKDGTTSDEGTWSGEAGAGTYTYGTGITALPTNVTAPTGRTFDHWEIGGVTTTSISATETDDKTIKAVYTKNTYNITWDLKDGTTTDAGTWNVGVIASTSYTYGTGYILPTGVTGPTGRTFDHWEIGGVIATEISVSTTGDKAIKAVYTNNAYNITWDLKDGTTSDEGTWSGAAGAATYTYGTGITTLPTNVTAPTGRTFDHWEIGGVTTTSISATETGDKTIKAVYTKNTYNITWDLKDGTTSDEGTWSGDAGATTYTYGTGITALPTNVEAPTGRTFDHWEIGGVTTTSISATETDDKTIKAVYTKNTYNITWDLKDGTTSDEGTWNVGVIASISYTYGTGYALPTGVTAPTGRTFDHWEIGGVIATEISASATGDKAIKAVYTNNAYNITWDLKDGTTSDEGTWSGAAGAGTYTYGTGITTLPTNVTAPTGRTFDHWEIGGVVATNISATETGDKTIKAVYTKNTYNITWDLKDGTTSDEGTWNVGVIASTSYTYGTGYTLPTGVTGPNGRTFSHWTIGTETVTAISATEIGDKTIKAVYTNNVYNITWDLKDGTTSDEGTWSGEEGATTYTYGTGITTLPTNITAPDGRTFSHWTIGTETVKEISKTATGDKTIKAVYTKNTYNITWDLRDGTTTTIGIWDNNSGEAGKTTYTYGTEYAFPTNVTGPTGRFFDYWTINDVKTTKITATDFGDKTIKAVYKNEEYTITWDLKDTDGRVGTWNTGVVASTSYIYGIAYSLPTGVTGPDGREFSHWTIDGSNATNIAAGTTGSKTVKAVYKNATYDITWDLKDIDGRDGIWTFDIAGVATYIYGTGITTLPTNVTGPSGREFDHWEIGGVATTSIAATEFGDKTVKAVYKNITYTITWDLKDGTTSDEGTWDATGEGAATYEYGKDYTFPTNVVAPNGRTFDHWEIGGVTATSIKTTDFGNKTIKAVYTKNTYTITWDLTDGITSDTGTWSGEVGATSYEYGTEYILPTNVKGPNGKVFVRWAINGTTVTKISNTDYGDKTIKAVYNNDEYNITYDLEDGNTGNVGSWTHNLPGKAKYTYGTAYLLPVNVTGPTGRVFDHWRVNDVDTEQISGTSTGDVVVKAVYRNEKYNITWDLKDTDGKGGTWGAVSGALTYEYSVEYVLPTEVTGPTGRMLDYWTVDGERATSIVAGSTGDKAIKAIYKYKEYKVQFKANTAKGSDGKDYGNNVDKAEATYDYSGKITMPNASEFDIEGFELIGFAKSSGAIAATWLVNTEYDVKDMSLNETGTNNIYPVYKELEVTIDFDGGSSVDSNGATYDVSYVNKGNKYNYYGNVTFPTNINNTGFKLIGFNNEAGQTTANIDAGVALSVKTLIDEGKIKAAETNVCYAVWKEKEYKVEFVGGSKIANGKTISSEDKIAAETYKYYGSIVMPKESDMKLTGFKLVGFNKNDRQNNYKYQVEETVNVKNLVTYASLKEDDGTDSSINKLYGVWEKEKVTITLEAVSGTFTSGERTKVINVTEAGLALKDYDGYEEPEAMKGYAFDYWADESDKEVAKDTLITGNIKLKAIYKMSDDDASKTKYVIDVVNDNAKGNYDGAATFEITLDDYVIDTLSKSNIVDPTANSDFTFVGWSWVDDDISKLIKDTDKYTDTKNTTLYAVYKKVGNIYVTLEAGTGMFANTEKRTKVLVSSEEIALKDFAGYEIPTKDDYEFVKWLDEDTEINDTDIIKTDITLKAVYGKKQESEVIVDDQNKKYVIKVENDTDKGTYTGAASFEIELGNNVYDALTAAGITNPTANAGWTFEGWSYNTVDVKQLIKNTDVYNDVDNVKIVAVYTETGSFKVKLDAGTGKFESNKSRTKVITSKEAKALNLIADYEEPIREGYKFVRWLDGDDKVTGTTVISTDITLVAEYMSEESVDGVYSVSIINNDATKGIIKVNDKESTNAKFTIKKGDDVLTTLENSGISVDVKDGYKFEGWSWTGEIYNLVKDGELYEDTSKTRLTPIYSVEGQITITLMANTGVFASNNSRILSIVTKEETALSSIDGYEKPVKSDDYTFAGWINDETNAAVSEATTFTKNTVLKATYKDNKGNVIGRKGTGTEEGGSDAVYTVLVKNEVKKGSMQNAVAATDAKYETATIELKEGDNIIDAINAKGLVVVANTGYVYEGWSFNGDSANLIMISDKYYNNGNAVINATYYSALDIKVILNANTGLFDGGKKVITLTSTKKDVLNEMTGYEEPSKSDGWTFERWEKADGTIVETTDIMSESGKVVELYAIWKSPSGEETGSDDSTKDGGEEAVYTVELYTDATKGTLGDVTRFGVKKGANVVTAMTDAGIVNPTASANWNFLGWSFTDNISKLIDDTTTYTDTTKTKLYAKYYEKNVFTVVLNANTGLFADNTTQKNLESDTAKELGNFAEYDVPSKSDKYTFNGWVDEAGVIYPETKVIDSTTPVILYATYKDDSDNVIGGKGTGSEEGAPEAKYTVVLQSESAKGKLGAVKSFEIKKGENVLSVMDAAGVSRPFVESPYYFVGWSFDDDFATTITDSTTYEDENKRVLYALYTSDTYTVTLKANSGMFANSSREKELIVLKGTLLVSADGYEEPIKAGGFTFNRWKKDGVSIQDLNTFVVDGDIELLAVYHDPEDKDVGNDDDTEAGGEKATYTIEVINDDTYGTYSGERYFEIKKDENVMYVMRKVGITEAVGNADYMFAGWAFNGNELVDSTTVYNNTEWTTLVITYRPNSYKSTVAFDSWAGYFADGTQTKVFTDIATGRIINTLDGYEEPTREGWKFIHWVDTNGQVVEATSTIRSGVTTLIARYEDAKGNEVGEGTHSHYVCGAVDACVHTDGILRVHSYGSSYKAVSKGEEIINYVNEELAKSEADRKNVYVYLLNDVDITSNIELDKNIKLYICLNGFYLNTKKILAKDSATNAEVIISNCKDTDVFVTELDSADNRPMFGTNGIHIFGGNNTIVIKAKGALVNTKGESSAVDKEIALQKVDLVGGEISDNTDFISLEGNSSIKLVDVNIKNVVAKDGAIVKARSNANVLIGNEVTIKNTKSNKAIIDDDGILNVADNAKLTMIDNTINKVANGVNGIILLGNATNYVSGDLEVTNNNLTLGDSYYNKVNGDETPGLLGGMIDKLFGIFAEVASPAGDVGYTAAIGFKNADVNIEVKNSKIIVANNNKADNTDVKAGYMYNILSNNPSVPIFTQVRGTVLDSESNIGVAFNTAEGEGIITNNKEVDSKIFKNTTYGKEEKIIEIKNISNGVGIERKTYIVEYDEGKPITEESGTLIQTYNKDGSITSENTRIRTGEIRAGVDTKLEDDTIYTAKGFDLATYSIVRPSNKEKGMLLPTATLSYINNVYDDTDDITDKEVIRAVATWREKELKSEGEDVVISKDDYEQIVDDAASDAESNVASYSEAEQVEIETEDKYYTVRYWLDGGNFEGSAIPESGYVEDTKAVRANKYTLVQDVEKVATESGIVKSYDFIGWSIKDGDSTIIEEIGAGVESDVVEVIANYKPSTYKITYHLNDGKIKGSTDDLVDTVVRTEKYILFKNVEKNGFAFAGWTKLNAEISDSNPVITVLEAETLDADIEVFAQYTSTTYTVRYHLDGGIIEGVEVVDDIYEDNTADTTKDYHFIEDVTKPGFEFLGWVTVAGNVTIDTIKAGDTNESLREVIAKYRATTFTVNYDADGGIIEGVESMTATPEVGKTYTLYTNVTKEDHEFLGWYDVTTDQRIVSITNAQIGEVYNVKAKFIKPTYNLTLHFSEEEPMASMDAYTIKNISSKIEYVLPTNYTYSGKEFRDWYYIKDGYKVSVSSIKPGNPDNITDVYIRFDDLIVHTINYYVRNDKNETEIMTPRDSSMVGRDVEVNGVKYKVYTTKVNKREDYVLETNVTKSYDYTEYGYGIVDMDFAGWTLGKRYWDNTAVSPNVVEKVKQGISKEDEQKGAGVSLVYDYYAYFVTRPIETVAIKYVLNGGKLVGKTVGTEAEYVEHVNVNNTYTVDQNAVKDGFRFAGWYGNEGLTDGPKFNYTPSELAGDKEFIPLYAKWDKISYSLKYHVKGGIMSGKILTDNDTIYKTEFTNTVDIVLDTNITKDGWTFAGWYDGEGENASKVEKISKGTNQNVDVYARWIKDTYVVTYVLDGGKIDGAAEDTYKVTYNRNNITTLITDIDKYGHKFLGWYTAATGGDKVETIANSDKEIEDNTVYAHWEDVRYTVKFILDGGTIKGKKLDEEGNYEEVIDGRKEVTLYDGTKVSRGDDKFLYWTDKDGNRVSTIEAEHKGDIILTANYKLAMVDLVYHFDGGLLPGLTTEEDTSYTVKYNSTKDYTLISDVEWKTRIAGKQMYKFDGWETKDGKPISMIPKDSEEIKEVYATWVYAAYQIVYHVNGGQIFGLYVDMLGYSYAGGNMWTEKKLATNITKEGCEFAGWYLEEDFSGEPITSIPVLPTYVRDGFIHVNAKWVQEKYSVTYNVGEGSFKGIDASGNTIKMSVENKFPYILLDEENVTYAGHKFDGWYQKDADGAYVGDEVVWIDANNKDSLVLYAKYTDDAEDDEAYVARKNNRAAKKEEGSAKRSKMIAQAIEDAGQSTKNDMSATSDMFYSLLIKTYVDEDKNKSREKRENAEKAASKGLLGSIVTTLFGDDDSSSTGDVVTVNTASLKAYTTISAENFGGSAKEGYTLDGFIATYIYDSDGNEITDDRFVGKVYKAGDTLVDIAEAYPNHTVGGRMVFIDTTLVGTSDPDPTPSDPGTSDPGTGTDPTPSPAPSPAPSPSPSYSPSNSGGSSGSRGGGGGGGGARKLAGSVPLQNTSVNLVVQVTIPANEGEWVYNEFGQRVGYKIKANSQFAKAMMSNEELKNNYLSADGGAYIRLKSGFFNINYANGSYYFGFDAIGNMMKGFVNTASDTKVYILDPTQGKLVFAGNKGANKYYLLENDSTFEGILYTKPIVIKNVSYTFNDEGAVISELTMGDASQGQWERDSSNGKWKCYSLDASGAKRYFINGIFDIKAQDNTTYKYIFDENGYMRTGLVQYQGKTYYCVESGDLQGTVVTGATNVNGMVYLFDNNGVLVTPDAQNANAGVVQLSAMEQLQAFMSAMQQMQQAYVSAMQVLPTPDPVNVGNSIGNVFNNINNNIQVLDASKVVDNIKLASKEAEENGATTAVGVCLYLLNKAIGFFGA